MTVGSSEHTELLLSVSVFLFVVSRTVVSSEHTELLLLVSLFVVSKTVGSSEHNELLLLVSLFVVSRTMVSSEHTELLLLVSLFVVSKTGGSSEHNELLLLVSLFVVSRTMGSSEQCRRVVFLRSGDDIRENLSSRDGRQPVWCCKRHKVRAAPHPQSKGQSYQCLQSSGWALVCVLCWLETVLPLNVLWSTDGHKHLSDPLPSPPAPHHIYTHTHTYIHFTLAFENIRACSYVFYIVFGKHSHMFLRI